MTTRSGTLGSYLRALREERKGSLEEMSRATRVGVSHLEALEADAIPDLPAPVFVKGFIRAYCDFLRVPADEALARYGDLLSARPVPAASAAPATRRHDSWASPVLVSLVLLIVFGGGLLALSPGLRRRPASDSAMAPTPPEVVVAPVATPSSAPVAPAPDTTPVQRLMVRAVELTWLRVQTDDSAAAEALLPPGATREWTAERRFLLTVGNAGGVELTLNGHPMPPLGAKGVVIRGLELPHAIPAAGS